MERAGQSVELRKEYKEAVMERRRWALRVLVSASGVIGTMAGASLAHAQPDPSLPTIPSIIDQLITSTPALSVDPSDEGALAAPWGGVGMICENLTVRCR